MTIIPKCNPWPKDIVWPIQNFLCLLCHSRTRKTYRMNGINVIQLQTIVRHFCRPMHPFTSDHFRVYYPTMSPKKNRWLVMPMPIRGRVVYRCLQVWMAVASKVSDHSIPQLKQNLLDIQLRHRVRAFVDRDDLQSHRRIPRKRKEIDVFLLAVFQLLRKRIIHPHRRIQHRHRHIRQKHSQPCNKQRHR